MTSVSETPVQWCERMQREARDGDTAYHYYQLAEMWRGRHGG